MTTPMRIEVDCAAGTAVRVPLTPEEVAAKEALGAARLAARQEAEAEEAALLDKVKASTDPAMQALAKLLGI